MQPEHFDFPVLNADLGRHLGPYYQDFSRAVDLVEGGHFGGIDSRGLPWHRQDGTLHYSPIRIAQYSLGLMTLAARPGGERHLEGARPQLDWLVASQEDSGPYCGCWIMSFDCLKYRWLRAPWVSALASGNAISALLRGWEVLEEARYLDAATVAYRGLHEAQSDRPLTVRRGGCLWYEEYPAADPLHVLNGHIYAALGVLDYARVSGDETAMDRWRGAVRAVEVNLDSFDLGYWSTYDLRFREPASRHYQKNIHIPLLQLLAELTGSDVIRSVVERWATKLDLPTTKARLALTLRLRRFHHLRGFRSEV